MFSQETQQFNHSADTVFTTFLSASPSIRWFAMLSDADPSRRNDFEVGSTRLLLHDSKTIIEEFEETVLEHDAPHKLALELRLLDFAISRNAPPGKMLPDAASLIQARKKIADGRALHRVLALLIEPVSETSCSVMLTYASHGQTGPKLGARLFARFLPNPARSILATLSAHLDEQ